MWNRFFVGGSMKNLFLFLKGLFIGIGKIIPGVSGSLLAVMLGVYEQAIYSINHLKEDYRKSLSFLIPLGCGIVLSVVFFSHILLYFLTHYSFFTMTLFLGLILGTVPSFQRDISFSRGRDFFLFGISFLIPFLIPIFSFSVSSSFSLFSFFLYFFLGFLDAATMIIPGISGTSIYLMLGVYENVLFVYSQPLQNIMITSCFLSGLLIGIFLVSFLVEFCLKKNRNSFFICIDGLLWSSICYLFQSLFGLITFSNLFFFCMAFGVGFAITKLCSK